MRERTKLDQGVKGYRELETGLKDNSELLEMAESEGDAAMAAEAERALFALQEIAAQRELESLLSGEADANDCYLEVNAGAGGTEAQDWAEMLSRMYMRWAEKKGYKVCCLMKRAAKKRALNPRRSRSAVSRLRLA
jgi:peptide chain release factor 2